MRRFLLGLTAALGAASPALAGPPFVTDDSEPTEPGHWEIYHYAQATRVPGETSGSYGLDINYGGAKDLQLTAVIPVGVQTGEKPGFADPSLAFKYRFIHQEDGTARPEVSFFPSVTLPIGAEPYTVHKATLLLPLWVRKDTGPWTVYGGGGYVVNPGRDAKNYWKSGLVVERKFGECFSFGGELYHQTADEVGGAAFLGFNIGATYKIKGPWSLMVSGGRALIHSRDSGRAIGYLALKADL